MKIVRLALPVTVAQLGMIVVSFADNIMVGRYSVESLAASSFVVNMFNVVILGIVGFSYGLTPLVGALWGRGRVNEIGTMLRAGLIANVSVGVLASLAMAGLYTCVGDLGQPEELMPLIRPFFLIYLATLLPMAVFNTFAQWSYAIRNTSMPMWIMLGCNVLNIIGNYAIIYGHFGAPELGLLGAGISTLASRVVGMIAIIAVFALRKEYREMRQSLAHGRMPRGTMGTVVKTSWPVALQMSFETGAFSGCAVIAGWIGTISLAAFQVILIVGTLGFCIYYSIGTAISVLTANEIGRGATLRECRRPAFDGYLVTIACMLISSTIFVVWIRPLVNLFTEDTEVAALAVSLLVPLVLYQLGDATQITFANALRGTSWVMPMLWISLVSYVIVGLPCSWLLALPAGLGLWGIELSFSVSLFIAAGLYYIYFMRATRKITQTSDNL